MKRAYARSLGFTIVELLIVIVVIAILAAISIVAYNEVQGKARDSARLQDMKTIRQAIEMYKAQTGAYPVVQPSGGSAGGWEASSIDPAGQFLRPLVDEGIVPNVPVDPVNNTGPSASLSVTRAEGTYTYLYYHYPAGNSGCETSRGAFYVIGILRTAGYGTDAHPESPGFSCSSRDWQAGFSWVAGGFTN